MIRRPPRSTLFPYNDALPIFGAEVIKVENPKGGDACRGWGPPFTEGTATAFYAFNRAKRGITIDRKSTRLNSSHDQISYAVFCLKKKKNIATPPYVTRTAPRC